MLLKSDEQVKCDENMKKLLIGLARVQIVQLGVQFIERGYIYQDEADMLEYLYRPYSELGGNGNGKYIFEQCMSLPRKTAKHEEEEDKQD